MLTRLGRSVAVLAIRYRRYDYGVATSLEQLNGAGASALEPYGQSKLAQVLWAQELTAQLGPDSSVFVNSFHPGAVASEIWGKNTALPRIVRDFFSGIANSVMWTCDEGALTGLYLGVHVGLDDRSVRGQYFHPQTHGMVPSKHTFDAELQSKSWAFWEELTR